MCLSVALRQFCVGAFAAYCALAGPLIADAQPQQSQASIEKLLQDGWEVAGYVSAWENRSLILFKHKDHKYLVQCSILIDVLRSPRLGTYCYEIR